MKAARWNMAQRRLASVVACVAFVSAVHAADEEAPAIGVVVRAVPEQTDWLVRVPAADKLSFRGFSNGDADTPGGAPVMYPGPLPVFLISVLTHGVISNSVQNSRAAAAQAEADKVLVPYQPTLDLIGQRPIVQEALARSKRGATRQLLGESAAPEGTWVLDMAPVFALTQDQRALVLDSVFAVFSPESNTVPLYRTSVRVVSHPRPTGVEGPERLKLWTSGDGRMLKDESAALLAEAIDIVLAELAAGPAGSDARQQTVRYPIGSRELMERAALIAERCDRLVLKTLRGGLISVPRRDEALSSNCEMKPVAAPQTANAAP